MARGIRRRGARRRTDRARGGYCVLAGGEGSGRRWWGGARVRWRRRRLGHRRDEFDWGFVEDEGKERGQGPVKRYFSLRGGSLP
jgi:hypothetical protein